MKKQINIAVICFFIALTGWHAWHFIHDAPVISSLEKLGDKAFKKGNKAGAVLYWSRALEHANLSDAVRITEKKLQVKPLNAGKRFAPLVSFLGRMRLYAKAFLRPVPLLVLQVGVLCALAYVMSWFSGTLLSTGISAAAFFSVALVGCVLGGDELFRRYDREIRPRGVIISPNLSLSSGPGIDFAVIAQASPVRKVKILHSQNGYSKIAQGVAVGWVSDRDLERV